MGLHTLGATGSPWHELDAIEDELAAALVRLVRAEPEGWVSPAARLYEARRTELVVAVRSLTGTARTATDAARVALTRTVP